MIRIARAAAYSTIQDAGRRGFRASGVPRGGAMDMPTLYTLNAMLGNDPNTAVIEWALTGGELVFETPATFALGGATAAATLGGNAIDQWKAYHAIAGDSLSIGLPEGGRFLYIGFAGGMEADSVMGSRSTYLPGQFGGIDGRRLRNGDLIPCASATRHPRPQVTNQLPQELQPPLHADIVRFVPRGQPAISGEWKISATSDRTGYRLESGSHAEGASITSEPVCPGAIQLPPGGEPIVLMADAPTIGGYRVAGAVISADLGAFAQQVPGGSIEFEPVTVEAAQRELDTLFQRVANVREWSLA